MAQQTASTIQITRPADTTSYSIGDTLSQSTSTGTVAKVGIGGSCRKIILAKSSGAAQATFDLHLFSADPGATQDNAAFAITFANNGTNYLGKISLAITATANGMTFIEKDLSSNPFLLPSPCYVVPVFTATYAPASAEQFAITFLTER